MFATKRIVATLAFAMATVAAAYAQVSTAELSGTVIDQTGAGVANAKVTITKADTAVSRDVTTDARGAYVATALQPGVYNFSVEAPGFRRTLENGVELQVSQRAEINFKLELGNVAESVEVAATAPLLESQSSSLGSVINTRLVAELPLNGRNFVQLATLSPGVNGTGFSTGGTIMSGTRPDDRRPGTEIFSNGNREGSNNFLYDGIDDNDRLTLSIVLRPAVDAIKEFKVQTNLYSADLGRNSGAVIDVVTKSGTNQLHGSLFEFLRNSAMDARSFFNAKGTPFPTFRYNQFGGSFGGPIVIPRLLNGRNKTFYFVDYEGFRRDSQVLQNLTVPTLAERNGDFSALSNKIYDPLTTRVDPATGRTIRDQFPNNIIPATRFDPLTAVLIKAYPAPQSSALINNYISNMSQKQSWNQGDVRVDHQISSNDNFFARWAIQQTATTVPNTFPATTLPGISGPISLGNEDSFAGTSFTPVQHAVASYIHIFSPRLLNEARAGFNRFKLNYSQEGSSSGSDLGNKFGIKNANSFPQQTGFPIISPSNYAGIGQSRSLPIFRTENTFEYLDNMTYTLGRHTLKFGEDFRRRQISEYQTNRGNGRFNFSPGFTNLPGVGGTGDSQASLLLGFPSLIEQDFVLAYVGQRGIENGLFIADDWRFNNKITFNIGLRWEYFSPYSEVGGRIANFDPRTATMIVPGRNSGSDTAGVQSDWKDFAPRFGMAWQVAEHTVIRTGFGLFYNPNGNGGNLLRGERNLPFGPIVSNTPGDLQVGQRVSDGFPAPPTLNLASADNPTGGVIGVAGNLKQAYAEQFNFTVEHEIAPAATLVKVAYVGNLGRRLGTSFDLNLPVPGTTAINTRRPFYARRPGLTSVGYYVSDGLSNYHALQISADKRLAQGLSLLLGYTWAHSIDNVATDFGGGTGTPQDVRFRNNDRGNSAFDIRQRFTLSYVYQIPGFRNKRLTGFFLGNWQTNGILQVQTGIPYTPTLAASTTNNGASSRPDSTGKGAALSNPTLQRRFDPGVFTTPAPLTYGNAGRDILYGPGRTNFDVSLFKDFRFSEQGKIQFRTEAFNLFNHPQFGQPNATIGSNQAGVINSVVGNPRQLQVALRLSF